MNQQISVFITSVALLAEGAMANPIAVGESSKIEKSWEKCMIFVDEFSATVSCEIGYKSITRASEDLYLTVPVFLPGGKIDPESVTSLIAARLECEGKVYQPKSVYLVPDVLPPLDNDPPKERVEVLCDFLIKFPVSKEFSLVVSYNQPLINQTAYYLPLFEGALTSQKTTGFSITLFTASVNRLDLVTSHEGRAKILKTRITILPKNGELIAAKLGIGEQAGADQPATKPADKPTVKDQPSTPMSKDAPR
jgi:hypothetical protein